MKRAFLIFALTTGCGDSACEWERRDYPPPPVPGDGMCVGFLAQRGAALANPSTPDICDNPYGACTTIPQWQVVEGLLPTYFVSDPDMGNPLFAEVSCNVRDCNTIEMAILSGEVSDDAN